MCLFQGGLDGVDDLLQFALIVDVAVAALLGVDQDTIDADLQMTGGLRSGLARVDDVITEIVGENPLELVTPRLVPSPTAVETVHFDWSSHG